MRLVLGGPFGCLGPVRRALVAQRHPLGLLPGFGLVFKVLVLGYRGSVSHDLWDRTCILDFVFVHFSISVIIFSFGDFL